MTWLTPSRILNPEQYTARNLQPGSCMKAARNVSKTVCRRVARIRYLHSSFRFVRFTYENTPARYAFVWDVGACGKETNTLVRLGCQRHPKPAIVLDVNGTRPSTNELLTAFSIISIDDETDTPTASRSNSWRHQPRTLVLCCLNVIISGRKVQTRPSVMVTAM